jgi:hypothetical protein
MASTDRREGRAMKRVMNVRLTPEQDDAVRGRAQRRGLGDSAALRELVDLGRLLDRAESHGVVVTSEAIKLMVSGGARLSYCWFEGITEAEADVLALEEEWQREQLDRGALLCATAEQIEQLKAVQA